MSLPRKFVEPVREENLPSPFRDYWFSPRKLNRAEYEFFLVDGELYIGDGLGDDDLIHHWTQDCCAGIACFMSDNNIEQRRDMPLVSLGGVYLFEVVPSKDYETSARDPETGRLFVVHSG